MAQIRASGNKSTELRVLQLFQEYGIAGWRRHQPVFGRPDFVFWKERVAVFVDGCFWHGCARHFKQPRNRAAFWRAKIKKNRLRDRNVRAGLARKGWTVIRIWEHALARNVAPKSLAKLRVALGRR